MALAPRPPLLVVDDEPSLREALEAALGSAYTVHTAATGAQACRLLQVTPIDLIILDALLATEHGLDLVPQLRARSQARILLLTGHGSEDLASRAVWAGVDGYLTKTGNILGALRAALQRLLPPSEPDLSLAARARQMLDGYPAKPFSLLEVADHLRVSSVHLRRVFRASYGVTPGQYLIRGRLDRAAGLLRSTRLGVEQIALTVGFPHAAWFNRLFKRHFGVSPVAYRATSASPAPHPELPGSRPAE